MQLFTTERKVTHNIDIPITVIGGRGPHGLALHLLMQERGLNDYVLVDPATHWLPLYGPQGPMQATGFLRSPCELDFSLGQPQREMRAFIDEDGSRPLANVYSLKEATCNHFNESTSEAQRAPRAAFWRYANYVAKCSGADQKVINSSVSKLEPYQGGWQVQLSDARCFNTRVVLLASGLMPQLFIPYSWQVWWRKLPEDRTHHAFRFNYQQDLKGKNVAVLGSSNIATWETAIKLAEVGAHVTLLSRRYGPIERQLPFSPHWFESDFMAQFMALPWNKRKRLLKKPPIPNSSLPGMVTRAKTLSVRVVHHAHVQYGSELWDGLQLQYKTPRGMQAEYFDHLVAATGALPQARTLPFLTEAACQAKAPIIVGGIGRKRPIMDDVGRWKNLPPLYPLGAHALMRAGHAANTLASATVYLPLTLPHILEDAGSIKDALELAA